MDFDNVGLLVGSEDAEISSVTVALDITPEVIDEAVKNGSELIISHHPVIFSPLKRVPRDSAVYRLAENGLSALCLHTNLDISPEFGVNTCLADAVGLKNASFVENECLVLGELDEETDVRTLAKKIKAALSCEGVRFTLGNKPVKKAAVCSGSGGDLALLAREKGADVLITGEIKHHELLDANSADIAVIDAGHFKTEDIAISPLCRMLETKFTSIKFFRSTACTDRVEYC